MFTQTFLIVERGCDQVLPIIISILSQRGLKVLPTFNLHSTRSDQQACPCPHHGTEQCDCQMIILLIYDNEEEPITLFLHGSNGQTRLSIDESLSIDASSEKIALIRQALNFQSIHAFSS